MVGYISWLKLLSKYLLGYDFKLTKVTSRKNSFRSPPVHCIFSICPHILELCLYTHTLITLFLKRLKITCRHETSFPLCTCVFSWTLTYGPKSGNKHYHPIYTLFIVPTILFFLFVFILKHLQSTPTWNSLPVFSFHVLDNLNTGFTFYNITFQAGSSGISALAYSGYAFLVRIQHKCVGSSQSISPGSTLRWPVLPLVKWTLITWLCWCLPGLS